MVPYGTLWYLMVPYGTLWYLMVLYGTLWYLMVPYGTLWYLMVPYGTLWYPVVLFLGFDPNTSGVAFGLYYPQGSRLMFFPKMAVSGGIN